MSTIPTTVRQLLSTPFSLSPEQIAAFRSDGFVKIRQVLTPEAVAYLDDTISAEVRRLNTQHLPIEERDTYGKAFLQIMNIWRQSEIVKPIVFSERLARIAADLLGVSGVRLYHDQALYKEPGGGHTPWHCDQYYWPLASDKTVTVWIPMQATPLEMGPLEFSAGSQHLNTGRQLKISDESQELLESTLAQSGYRHVTEPFETGEVSFHLGWLYHRAGPNRTDQMRKVMTMIYMDRDMRLKAPENENQQLDWDTWCPGAQIGQLIDTPLNPVVFET